MYPPTRKWPDYSTATTNHYLGVHIHVFIFMRSYSCVHAFMFMPLVPTKTGKNICLCHVHDSVISGLLIVSPLSLCSTERTTQTTALPPSPFLSQTESSTAVLATDHLRRYKLRDKQRGILTQRVGIAMQHLFFLVSGHAGILM